MKGTFPLRSLLGTSEQGAVFLSEYDAGKSTEVAIKLVPVSASRADQQLAQWRAAAALSHPHLVRLLNMGRCQLDGREFLFVVMEYGEQTLAQFLSERALTPAEVRALLLPTLDALAFLHDNQLAHGRLKPSNFLVVNDRLKLSSDAILPLGPSGGSAASDMWSLGMTLVQAFTQRSPGSSGEPDEANTLLANIPAPFSNPVRRCLNPNAAGRPTAAELQALFKSTPEAEETSDERSHAHPVLLAIPATLLVLVAVLLNPQRSDEPMSNSPPPAVPTRVAPPVSQPAKPALATKPSRPARVAPVVESEPLRRPAQPAGEDSDVVISEVIPDVPAAMIENIQGRILVTVRVLVDPDGNVMAAMLEKTGPNKNLANAADLAAREWKFVPADQEANRVWILTFTFSRLGVLARATAV